MEKEREPLQALEFFSGVGGHRYAIRSLALPVVVAKAYDINIHANAVYEHNWPGSGVCARSIAHLRASDLVPSDVWLMSPPCQPFTRGGKRLDARDPRSAALLRLICLMEEAPPRRGLLLENVPGFHGSECQAQLCAALEKLGFAWEHYLVSPDELLGVPNRRTRYYMVAWRSAASRSSSSAVSRGEVLCEGRKRQPVSIREWIYGSSAVEPSPTAASDVEEVGAADDEEGEGDDSAGWRCAADERFLLSSVARGHFERIFSFRFHVVSLDAVGAVTQVFTKSYGGKHFYNGGSFLSQDDSSAQGLVSDARVLCAARVRMFTPFEVAALLGFPVREGHFAFPSGVSVKQRFALLGNSISVPVVALVLRRLLRLLGVE